MTLGDRVAVMRKGILQQVASPRSLRAPREPVRRGVHRSPPMNFLPAAVEDGQLKLPFISTPVTSELATRIGDRRLLVAGDPARALRGRHPARRGQAGEGHLLRGAGRRHRVAGQRAVRVHPHQAPPEIRAQLAELARELDSEQLRTQLVASLDPMSRVLPGERAQLWVNPARMHRFDPRTVTTHEARHGRPGARRSDVRPGGRREQLTTRRPDPVAGVGGRLPRTSGCGLSPRHA